MKLKPLSALLLFCFLGCGRDTYVATGGNIRPGMVLGYNSSPDDLARAQKFDRQLVNNIWVAVDTRLRPLPNTYFVVDRYNSTENNGTDMGRYRISFSFLGKVLRGVTHQYPTSDGAIPGFIQNSGSYLPLICNQNVGNRYGRAYAAKVLSRYHDVTALCEDDVSLEYAGTLFYLRNVVTSEEGSFLTVDLKQPYCPDPLPNRWSFKTYSEVETLWAQARGK